MLAGSIESASSALHKIKLDPNNIAIVEEPEHLQHTVIYPDETIYMTTNCTPTMLNTIYQRLDDDLQSGQTINFVFIKP